MSKTRIIAVVLAVFLLFSLISFAVYYVRRNIFIEGYEKLQPGDSKQLVVDSLGQPAEIAQCGDSGKLKYPCREEYWYYSFMERWVIFLDKDGSVLGKAYNVSY